MTASLTPTSTIQLTPSNTPTPSVTRCPYIYDATFSGYSCAAGYTLSGSTCYKDYSARLNYVCDAGWTLSGSTCSSTYGATLVYTCNAGETLSGSQCVVAAAQNECAAGDTYMGSGVCRSPYAATATGVCNSGFTKSGSYCNKNTAACGATLCGTTGGSTYGCFSGTLKAAKVCSGTSYCTGAPCGASPGGYFGIMNSGGVKCAGGAQDSTPCPSGTSMYGTSCQCRDAFPQATTYSCAAGDTLTGTSCYSSYSASYSCSAGYTLSGTNCLRSAGSYYTCPNSGTLSVSTCTLTNAASSYYDCPTGGSLSSSTCTLSQPADFTYSCPLGGSVSGTRCILPDGQCLSPSPTNTPTNTPTPSNTPSRSQTPSTTQSITSTPSNSGTPSNTETPSPSNTPAPRINWQPFGPLYNYQFPIHIGDADFTECIAKFEHEYQVCGIKKEEVDSNWFDCSIRLCLEVYPLDEQIESREVCISTITSHYEEGVRQQGFIDEFKDIQTTVCISASNTPAAIPSKSQTPSPTARPTPTQTPTSSGLPIAPSITPSPAPSPICIEWFCPNLEDSLTDEMRPRCVYAYEGQTGMRRLQWECPSWQYKVPMEWGSCYDSCPWGMYSYQPKMECLYSCPEGYYSDSNSWACVEGGVSGSCPKGQFYDGSMCTDVCPMGTFADYNSLRCVTQCPEGTFGDKYYGRCVDRCSEPYYGDKSVRVCIEGCPEFTVPNDETRTCDSTLVYSCKDPEHILEGTTCYRYSAADKRPCCGNDKCEPLKGEDYKTCPSDCLGTDYGSLTWNSQWNDALNAQIGSGYKADWTEPYRKFDFCIGSCKIDISHCADNWKSDSTAICEVYTSDDYTQCGEAVNNIRYNTLTSSEAWNAYNNAQNLNGCNGGGATCGDTFCDSFNGEDCNSCPQDCGNCMWRRQLRLRH